MVLQKNDENIMADHITNEEVLRRAGTQKKLMKTIREKDSSSS